MTARPAASRGALRFAVLLLLLLLLLAGSLAALDWNLDALASASARTAAWRRVAGYLTAFAHPDLSGPVLARGLRLAVETAAVALLGTALGLLLAWPLALGSSYQVALGSAPALTWPQRLRLETCRLVLDALRGVPDFAWAIVIANFTGIGPVTGLLAIAVSVAGILGKVLGEQWDNVTPDRYAALHSTGATRLQVFCYGIQPLAGRGMLSFVLMRTECAIRNSSVIGVVGGGGLGAGLWDEYSDGNWARVATMLLFMLAVTASADLGANFLRYQLRTDPNHPRAQRNLDLRSSRQRRSLGVGAVLLLLGSASSLLAPALARAFGELQTLEGGFVADYTTSLLFLPDLSIAALQSAAVQSIVPLAVGILGTTAAVLAAAALVFPASIAFQLDALRFTGERTTTAMRVRRVALVGATRGAALLLRGMPEVAWVVLLSVFFQGGITPCVLAVVLHSTGVLHRVFTEAVDDVPYRRLEQISGTCRPQTFIYGALPEALRDWRTYAFFQFEVNVRIGIVLGMVGAGGLGDKFHSNLLFRDNHRACTYLWAMVLLSVAIDRLSRLLLLRRKKC